MPSRLEDYALVGDCETAGLVGKDGSIDWLCLPRFDSGACFAALLGTPEHGRWQICPASEIKKVTRVYREGTLILETTFETDEGVVTLIDGMAIRAEHPVLIRCVRGERGQVSMRLHLVIRFDYGSIVPWVTRLEEGGIRAVAGPDTVHLRTPVPLQGEDHSTGAEFTVSKGEEVPFMLSWHPSHETEPPAADPLKLLRKTEKSWKRWSKTCKCEGPWAKPMQRSLLTLKALTYAPTGGVVAALTTSLPEQLGGVRNWDYRFCWLRDTTFTLYALMAAGYKDEARAWRQWVLRAAAGNPDKLQIMYGLAGERRLTEWEADWLPGYEGARPVRIGNSAAGQFQLDVYGELLDTMYQSRRIGLEPEQAAWRLEMALVRFLESAWKKPDQGIWEVRGPQRHFTHSKMMAWVAFDRAVKAVEKFGVEGPVDHWREVRDTIHREVCVRGFNTEKNTFVQYYDSKEPDASLLMMPLVGFLPASDPRVAGTVAAIERELLHDGFVMRYRTKQDVDGLPPGEGAFLPCTFWLADNYVLLGRQKEAEEVFERLLALCNDVGLISEEYDPKARRLVGNFPQAFTHVGLINTAMNLSRQTNNPAEHRKE
ncbi:MAG TPA: glycoside hydrolase family 15 protein [Gemmataceae bacterium]|nr:glycoside hydrolase family 15 protein [Gemmataceae bacterium]